MPTPYDIPSPLLIKRTVEYFKRNVPEITPPKWAPFVKTGAHSETLPIQKDWWQTRCASLLRKIYVLGPIGIARLRKRYGGRKSKGNVGKHKSPGSSVIIRKALQQLEKAGYIRKIERKGRILTSEGQALLDSLAFEVKKNLEKRNKSLQNYG